LSEVDTGAADFVERDTAAADFAEADLSGDTRLISSFPQARAVSACRLTI